MTDYKLLHYKMETLKLPIKQDDEELNGGIGLKHSGLTLV